MSNESTLSTAEEKEVREWEIEKEQRLAQDQQEGLGATRVNNELELDMIVAVVRDYMQKKNMPAEVATIKFIHNVLYNLKNSEAVRFLKYINMGFGIIWILPQFVQADSMMISRPGGFTHFAGKPHMSRMKGDSDETQYENYITESYSAIARMSLGTNPGIFWHNCALVDTQAAATSRVIPVDNPCLVRDAVNWLESMRRSGTNKLFTLAYF